MSERDELESALEAARELLDEQLATHMPAPDFADVLVRAGEHDAPVEIGTSATPSPCARSLAPAERDQLDQINADLCEVLDATLDAGLDAGLHPPARRWHRPPRWLFASAAAVVLAAFAGVAAAHSYLQARQLDSAGPLVALVHAQAEHAQQGAELRVKALLSSASQAASPIPPSSAPSTPATTPAAAETAPETAPEPNGEPDSPAKHRASAAELADLDAQAYALLRVGKREQARREFANIVKVGGKSEYAELAFGELFAIAQQTGGEHELAKLWRTYLKRFSHGRYADDARAGLCRRASGKAKSECWTNYLEQHPRGAARNEAARESASP